MFRKVGGNGAPGRSRTSDLLVRSQLLYPAELRAHIAWRCNSLKILEFAAQSKRPTNDQNANLERSGAPGRIRTSDPLVRSQMLYPAELRARKTG
jgi:hypothetical protein